MNTKIFARLSLVKGIIAASSLLLLQLCSFTLTAQIYSNGFEGGGIAGTTSFTGGATGDANLNIAASAWSTSGSFVTFVGTAPTSATSMALQPGTANTTTWTLDVPVNAGYSANITALELDYRSTSTSYNSLVITINGTTVYSGAAATDAAFHHIALTGLTILGITGSISVVSVMSGGSHGASSTFRYDNVAISGAVIPANHAPSFSNGTSQSLSVCQNTGTSLDALLAVDDVDVSQVETWSVAIPPAHGSLIGFNGTTLSNGAAVLPSGLSYIPVSGYSGPDVFTIQVNDGFVTAATTINVTVNPAPPFITGPSSVCAGSTAILSDAAPGGLWSSGDLAVATVDPVTGVVSGVAQGSLLLTYTLTGTGCSVLYTLGVDLGPAAISGQQGVCAGSAMLLSDAVSGGAWTSANTAIAGVSPGGVVTGIAAGTAVISYMVGNCAVSTAITVSSLPAITGNTSVCAGLTIALSDAAAGGVWTSGNTLSAIVSANGIVTGVASGTAAIDYTISGCWVGTLVTIGFPIDPISGSTTLCAGVSALLSDATPGGVWSSDNNNVAIIAGNGTLTGVFSGTATIYYARGGCAVNTMVTINASSAGVITGKDSLCAGAGHSITLSDAALGGVWSSANTTRAVIDPLSGVVLGVSSGFDTIKYKIDNVCGSYTAKKRIYVRTASKCATGFDPLEETIVNELKVYPNPAHGAFVMDLVSDANEEIHVIVTNLVGTTIQEFYTVSNKVNDMDLHAAPGIYILTVYTDHERYFAKVVIN